MNIEVIVRYLKQTKDKLTLGWFCSMFRKNDSHYQDELFSHYQSMRPSVAKLLNKTWAPVFYEHVFCKINEDLFAPMYCLDTGRPNVLVNILMSLEIIKNMFGYTDQELIEQFYFNFQVNYALGIRNLGEVYLAERTLYEFRERVYRHILEYPEQDEVIFQQFEILTKNFIEQAGIKTDDQRMDSTLISPNIKKAGRLSLALDVLVQAVRGIASNMLSDNLKQVLRDSFRTDLLYRTRNQELESRFQKVLNLMQEVDNLANKDRNLASKREMVLLKRFLGEQAAFDESKGIWLAKPSSEIESGSLQSAYDSDATFRNKAGKNHSGYVLNVSETSSKENPIQVITDFSVQPNNISDVEMAKERIPIIKQRTDVKDIYLDGGYYGQEVIEMADELEVNLHYTDMTGRKAPSDKLSTTSFKFDDDMKIISCPQGKIPFRSDFNPGSKTSSCHFKHEDCQGCPNFDICPVKTQKKDRILRVSLKTIQADRVRDQIHNIAVRRENTSYRAGIEATNSALKRGEDLNNLYTRGVLKTYLVTAYKIIARNIKQFSRMALGKLRKPKRPKAGILCPNLG